MNTINATRVVTKTEGGHVLTADAPMSCSAKQLGEVRYVLTRNDGWSLACSARHLKAARKLWDGQWTSIEDLQTGKVEILAGWNAYFAQAVAIG